MDICVYENCCVASLSDMRQESPYGMIHRGAVVVQGDKIVWVGDGADVPSSYDCATRIDLGGRLLTPALLDCHTHLVYGGNRAHEFEMRLNGASYADIARAGGGIVSSVQNVRIYTVEQLVAESLPRLDVLLAEGVGTVEIKSGYGLTIADELKMLRVAQHLEAVRDVRILKTFLGAHAIPPEYTGNGDAYIEDVCIPALHQGYAEGLIDAVDAFCETIAFDCNQVKRVFDEAQKLGIPIKIHAEQLSNLHGTKLACAYGALSADHVEYLDEDGVQAMAQSGTVAVLLPGAFYSLNETQKPPIQALRKHRVPMAVATDCNPGTSPVHSLLLAMNMACTLFGLTPEESLLGATKNASQALGLGDILGTIDVGKNAEFAVWNVHHPAELSYRIGYNPLYKRIYKTAV